MLRELRFSCRRLCICIAGFHDLSEIVEKRLAMRIVKRYSSRKELYRPMLSRHSVFADFVTKNEKGTHFHCRVCGCEVAMKAHCPGEFGRHFQSD